MTPARQVVRWLAWPVLGLIVVLLWPARLGGDTTFVIVRGSSMEPKFHTGDLVVARAQGTYQVGDIVVFRVPNASGGDEMVIHRLLSIAADGSIVTQGDNRSTPDSFTLHLDDIVGSPVVNIAMGGTILAIFSTWWFLALAAGVLMLWRLWPDDQPEAASGTVDEGVDDLEIAPVAGDLSWFTSVMGGDVLDGANAFDLWAGDLDESMGDAALAGMQRGEVLASN